MHHGKPVFTTGATHLPPLPPPKKMNGPKITFLISFVFLSQVILLWRSSITSCQRRKPRPYEIEIVSYGNESSFLNCSQFKCRPGSGLSIPCGTSVASSISIDCVNCVKGVNYSDTYDYSQCKSCRNCSSLEKSSGNCTTTEYASCFLEICSKGFYWNNETNACDQCSDCCGLPLTNHEKQCVDSGLPVTRQCRETPRECVTTYYPNLDNGLSSSHVVFIVMVVAVVCLPFAVICHFCVKKFSLWTKFKRAIGRGSQGRTELVVSFTKLKDDDDLESVSVYRSASYAEGADNKRILTSG